MWNVLIVDDEEAILDGLERVLPWEEYGLEIVARASLGMQALDILDRQDIHIMVTDIQMPDITGHELIERAHTRNHQPHTIILTAHDQFDYVKKAINLGVENYLLKPINSTELSSTLIKTIENIQQDQYTKFAYSDIQAFRENLLNRWVTGTIQIQELLERAELARINLNAHEYTAVIVKLLNTTEKNITVFAETIRKAIFKNFKGDMFINSFGHIVFLLHGQGLSGLRREIEHSVCIGISDTFAATGISSFTTIGKPVLCSDKANIHRYIKA